MGSTVKPIIRPATVKDLDAIWQLWKDITAQKAYFPYDESYTREQIEAGWINLDNLIGVAEVAGGVAGAYIVKPNQPGYGSHVANAAYMVATAFRGKGIGKQLCAHSLQAAKAAGYRAMQFNLVVSTNTAAIQVWESFGFQRIGIVPKGFYQEGVGFVNAYIFYRFL